MNENSAPCEANGCFVVTDAAMGLVAIHGDDSPFIREGWAVDTAQAWRIFRDEIKAGKYDHIGKEISI